MTRTGVAVRGQLDRGVRRDAQLDRPSAAKRPEVLAEGPDRERHVGGAAGLAGVQQPHDERRQAVGVTRHGEAVAPMVL